MAQGEVKDMAAYQSELAVITKAKDLCSYVMTVTDKSPKRFRFTLVAKLQNYALDIIENLYRANEVFVKAGDREKAQQRIDFQHHLDGIETIGLYGAAIYGAGLHTAKAVFAPAISRQRSFDVSVPDYRQLQCRYGKRAADGKSVKPMVCPVLS